jgi:hypothetical protein
MVCSIVSRPGHIGDCRAPAMSSSAEPARFLGYEIMVLHADHKHDQRGHRSINAEIGLKVPVDVIRAKCAPFLHHGRRIRRTERIVNTDFSIVAQFQAEFRGVAEYYRLAFNRHRLGRLNYVMERSLTKTLARKYRIRVPQVYHRYRAVLDTEHGPRRGLQVTVDRVGGRPPLVAQWGGISLARDINTTAPQRQPATHLEQPPVRARATAPGRRLRTVRINGPGRSAPYPGTQRPQSQRAETATRMGHAHGHTSTQDPRRLPRMPRGHPRRTSHTRTTMSAGGPAATESGHGWFGGSRQVRTSSAGTSLAAYPTSRRDL